MTSIIIKGQADTMARKAHKKMGKAFLDSLLSNKKPGDHICVPVSIPAGSYTFSVSESSDGHVQLDFTPGIEI